MESRAGQKTAKSAASVASGQAFVTASEESEKTMENEWLAHSRATHHMTHRRECTILNQLKKEFGVTNGNNHVIDALGRGNIDVIATIDNRKVQHKLCNVLLVPNIGRNLLSVGAAADNGVKTRLSKAGIKLMSSNYVIACGTRISDGLYTMNFKTIVNASANMSSA